MKIRALLIPGESYHFDCPQCDEPGSIPEAFNGQVSTCDCEFTVQHAEQVDGYNYDLYVTTSRP